MTPSEKRYWSSEAGRANTLRNNRRQYLRRVLHHKARLAVARSGGCVDCGSHDELHHHHLDPATKRCKVSVMRCYSDERFWAEVAKCVVLCADCHRARHSELVAA